ncbi:MAG: hydroxyethylthiazole kinase [Deltaproteobacteria bacterium]|jgi:hydroxyethylthiazole kinase|nr:hydroxyethylthiazole kinase [Deltaproteobacteria bacterium]
MADWASLLDRLKASSPLVLCLTNTVTVNDCANALLAVGASPVMSEDPQDAESLARLASALVINIGTLNEASLAVMRRAAAAAAEAGVPIVLDPVGAGATPRRLAAALEFLPAAKIVRGNASEILALCAPSDEGSAGQKGVDSTAAATEETLARKIAALAESRGLVAAVTGPTDLVADGATVLKVAGGTPLLTKLTGAGCLLSALIGAYVGANPDRPLLAAAGALRHLARAAEKAEAGLGTPGALGGFKAALFDWLGLIAGGDLLGPGD